MKNFIYIPNYPLYQFCNETLEIKSLRTGRILKPTYTLKGYYQTSLWNKDGWKTFKRSQICWLANKGWLPVKGSVVDHIDEDKTNDFIDNLQILTNRQNVSKANQHKGRTLPTGVVWRNDRNKYQTRAKIAGITKHVGYYLNINDASKAYYDFIGE